MSKPTVRKPLLNIDLLIARDAPPTKAELNEIRNDMNEAVCFMLRMQEHEMPRHLRKIAEHFLAPPTDVPI